MSDIAKQRTEALHSPTFRDAEFHSRRLGGVAMNASGNSWAHDEAMRFVRHAQAEWQIREGLARLAALNASYQEVRL